MEQTKVFLKGFGNGVTLWNRRGIGCLQDRIRGLTLRLALTLQFDLE